MFVRLVRPIRATLRAVLLVLPVVLPPAANAQEATEQLLTAVVEGHLGLRPDNHLDADDSYAVYFHVPVETGHQVPLKLEVESPGLLDSRLIRTTNGNVLGVARVAARADELDWRAWVLIRSERWDDLPRQVPLSALADLPDSTLPYLQSTATSQLECEVVQQWADYHSWLTEVDLLARLAVDRAAIVPYAFPPSGDFDACTALTGVSTCTGHAHAATALLRSVGIPARTKLSMVYNGGDPYDMHWTVDLFLPGAGWVGVESTGGQYPYNPVGEVVMYCCDPADEFPLYTVNGITSHWHNSDPDFGPVPPAWGGGALFISRAFSYPVSGQRETLMAQARRLFRYELACRGARLTPEDEAAYLASRPALDEAIHQLAVLRHPADAIPAFEEALAELSGVRLGTWTTRYATSFENDVLEWARGGEADCWEWGTPAIAGLDSARTGRRVWATNLDGDYPNSSDCWLQSPAIDLGGLSSAQLEFWLWNQTQGDAYWGFQDYLWVEISRDGGVFEPVVGQMSGTNDDPDVVEVCGWARCDADLTPYVGSSVRLRFRFRSDVMTTYAGVYLDDVRVTGRAAQPSAVPEEAPPSASVFARAPQCFPNPFNPRASITFELQREVALRAAVYDLAGRQIAVLREGPARGEQRLEWDGLDAAGQAAAAGSYLLRVRADDEVVVRKLVLVR